MTRKPNFKLNWKYAIGEILLIFIGISLAFGLQQWANNVNQHRKGVQYLDAFLIELENNLVNIDNHVAKTDRDVKRVIQFVERINSDTATRINQDFITEMIEYLGPPYYESLSVASFQDIINSGGIEFIKDGAIRRKIIEYGVVIGEYESRVAMSLEKWNTILSPYFQKHANLSKMDIGGLKFGFSEDLFTNDKTAFIQNRDFTNILRVRIIRQSSVLEYAPNEFITDLKDQISNYLLQ